MRLPIIRKYIADGMMQILPMKPQEGFNHVYTVLPNGNISCEDSIKSKIKNQTFQEGNKDGFLEIEISKNENLIDFYIHSIFYSKNIAKNSKDEYKEELLLSSLTDLSKKKKSKDHSLFLFKQFNLQPELDCMSFLNELDRHDDLIVYDYPNKNIYQQVRVSIIHNTKEVIVAFHNSYHNLLIYKTKL